MAPDPAVSGRALVVIDAGLVITYQSPAYAELFAGRQTGIGQRLPHTFPDLHRRAWQVVRGVFDSGIAATFDWSADLNGGGPDLPPWSQITITPICTGGALTRAIVEIVPRTGPGEQSVRVLDGIRTATSEAVHQAGLTLARRLGHEAPAALPRLPRAPLPRPLA